MGQREYGEYVLMSLGKTKMLFTWNNWEKGYTWIGEGEREEGGCVK